MKIIHSISVKIITFILFIACLTGIIALGMNFSKKDAADLDTLSDPDFIHSSEYQYQLQDIYSKLFMMGSVYLKNMKEDGTVSLTASQKQTLQNTGVLNQNNEVTTLSENFVYYVCYGKQSISNSTYKILTEAYLKANFDRYYYRAGNRYYSSDGEHTNTENGRYLPFYQYESTLSEWNTIDNTDLTIYFAPKNEYVAQKQIILTNTAQQTKKILLAIIPLVLFALILAIVQIIITGQPLKNDGIEEEPVTRKETGKIYTELILAGMTVCTFFEIYILSLFSDFQNIIGLFSNQFLPFQLIYGFTIAFLAGLFFLGILYLVRRLKQKNLIRSSFSFIILREIVQTLKKIWNNFVKMDDYKDHGISKQLFRRQIMSFLIIGFLLFMTVVFFASYASFLGFLSLMLVFILLFLFLYQNNQDFKAVSILCEHIKQLYNGNNEYHSFVPANSPIAESALQLNNISEGVKKSVDQQVKAERIKIDLVTNVSHDLKTPLTSIIGYIDLLSKQELTPEASDYVKILEVKAERLKKIVSDLFELAKITSGNEELAIEELDCVVLVNQVIADMEDAILASKKSIKMSFEEETAMIYADGSKLYRVFQNLIDNALKYSMDGTRIFINQIVTGNEVITTIKNTASYELDFCTEEILERFARGDKSRSSEGNGLGLSIAKGFANACGGDLKVEIDGDLFKVSVSFPVLKINP